MPIPLPKPAMSVSGIIMEEEKKPKPKRKTFRTIPWEILQLKELSSEAKMVASVIWCNGNCKRIKPKGKKNIERIIERDVLVRVNLSHAEIMDRWGKTVTDECLRQHLVKLEKAKLFQRGKDGRISIDLGRIHYRDGEVRETGLWDKGLNISAPILRDDALSDSEKIVSAGLGAFPRIPITALAEKLGIPRRTITRIIAKLKA